MEPATHVLEILHPQPDHLWTRLRAILAEQGSPPIAVRREAGRVVFAAATGSFMLRARVADALGAVWDHDAWQRVFRPLD